jgi:thioredoxin 1
LGGAVLFSYLSPANNVNGEPPRDLTTSPRTGGAAVSTVALSSRIEHADKNSFYKKVLRAETPVLVDFYADWCGPCKALAPVLEELAREVPGAKIVKVNVDRSPELADHYGIDSIPSLIVFREGRASQRHQGLASKEALRRLLVD